MPPSVSASSRFSAQPGVSSAMTDRCSDEGKDIGQLMMNTLREQGGCPRTVPKICPWKQISFAWTAAENFDSTVGT